MGNIRERMDNRDHLEIRECLQKYMNSKMDPNEGIIRYFHVTALL